MPYLVVEDFRNGLDYRKIPVAAAPGTLQVARNVVINRGGEIESSKAWTTEWLATKPDNSPLPLSGLFPGVIGGRVMTFGHELYPGVPTWTPTDVGRVRYVPLDTGGLPITRMLGACQFNGGIFSIPVFGGGPYPYFNGFPLPGTEPIVADRLAFVDCMTYKNCVYVLSRSGLYRSKIGDATQWDPVTDIGSFAIDLASTGLDQHSAVALGVYDQFVVVYGRNQIQFWLMDPDPAKCTLARQLNNVGAFVAQSVAEYGDRDAFFVSDAGVRSLRVRDSSGAATVNDVGDPIDTKIAPWIPGSDTWFHSVVEHKTGRYMVGLPNGSIYVYSRSDGVTAWTEIKLDFSVDGFASAGGRLLMKSGNRVYLYGGAADDAYFDSTVPPGVPVVQTAFMDMGKPATRKVLQGIDVACEGGWIVEVCSDIGSPNAWVRVATVTGTTYDIGRLAASFEGTHFAMRFTGTSSSGRRKLSSIVLHYQAHEAG